MPIYEYHCPDCGHDFSFLHKRFNEPFPACPQCGSTKVSKELSTFSTSAGGDGGCEFRGNCPGSAGAADGHHCCGGCCHHH